MTRITFPYLLLITLVTLWSGVLNATGRFAVAAAAPVLLNIALLAFVQMAFLFKTPAHAAGWGVFAAGLLEAALLAGAAWRAGLLAPPLKPQLSEDVRRFFSAFLPACHRLGRRADRHVRGHDPVDAAARGLGLGALLRRPHLPAADGRHRHRRRHGAAAGDVEAHRRAGCRGARTGAEPDARPHPALRRALLGGDPLIPELIIRAVFQRGAFDERAVGEAAGVLAAYGVGLIAAVCIRGVVASFHARGDTRTPMMVSLAAVAVNVALKFALVGSFGVMGLALATALGASLNLAALIWIADGRRWFAPDRGLLRAIGAAAAGSLALALCSSRPPRRCADAGGRALRLGDQARPARAQRRGRLWSRHLRGDAVRGAGAPALSARIAIVGGGPAGLIAAEHLAGRGHAVTIHDRMPSLGRKFLLAGRGGLNLTHSEPLEPFTARYREAAPACADDPRLSSAGLARLVPRARRGDLRRLQRTGLPALVQGVAAAARLAQAARLARRSFRPGHRWTGWAEDGSILFDTPEGR